MRAARTTTAGAPATAAPTTAVDEAPGAAPVARATPGPVWWRCLEAVGVLALVAFGTYERAWVAAHPLGTLTSDGAVVGLMASHLLHHGQVPAYMWGQSYGAGSEAMLTAVVFAAVGASTSALLATTALTSALATLAMWWAGRAIVGTRAATYAVLAWWSWSSLFLWRSLKPGGTYLVGLAVAWVAVGLLARWRRGDARAVVLGAAGLAVGLSVWSSPMTLQLLVPTAIWCWPLRRSLTRRRVGLLSATTVLGASPALWFGLTHRFSNLLVPGGSGGLLLGAPERLAQFFWFEVPIAVSGRVEGSFSWVGGPLGFLVSLGALGAFYVTARAVRAGRAPRCRLPVLAGCCLPVLYALNQDASVVGQGRYVLLGASMVALLLGVALENAPGVVRQAAAAARWRRLGPSARAAPGALLALLVVLGAVAIREEPASLMASFPVGGAVRMPFGDAALRALVAEHDVTRAYAPYWMAYRLTFETSEHTLAVPFYNPRYPPMTAVVARSARPAYLFVTAAPTLARFESWCATHGVATTVFRRGAYTAVLPDRRVLPASVPHDDLT